MNPEFSGKTSIVTGAAHGCGRAISLAFAQRGASVWACDVIEDAALHAVYCLRPLIVRMGGTVPISELFQRHIGVGTVFFSFSTADEDYHAPNEFFRVQRVHRGLEAWARYWEILGEARA